MHRSPPFRLLSAALFLLVLPNLASATTRHVRQDGSGDFTTVGAAVAAAMAGDVIEVGPGVYKEKVDVFVTLTFVSTAGAAATVMDGENTHYPLWFRGGTGHVVDGFTFQHGRNVSGGGAIRCMGGATLTLRNSVFDSNYSEFDGGGLFTRDPGAFIDAYDCVFKNNYADHNGGAGIAILGSRINYTRCQFFDNTSGEQNSGVSCDHSSMDVQNCLFVGNSSASFSCIYYYFASGNVRQNTFHANHSGSWSTVLIHVSTVDVIHNIFSGDTAGWGLVFLGGSGAHECNVYYQNALGPMDVPLNPSEIEANPLFCNPPGNDFGINLASPAAPGNNSCGVLIGAYPVSCLPVAVAISSFDAVAEDGLVRLRGVFRSNLTVSEVNVYRGEGDAGLVRIASVPATDGELFEYADRTVAPGKSYRYQIGVRDADGEIVSQIQSVRVAALSSSLQQNRPNPFNPTTTIRYTVASAGHVRLVVYDAAGHAVRTLVDENVAAGVRDETWDGRDDRGSTVASGVYFCKMTAGKFSETRRMVMLK